MDRARVLARYDREMREDPPVEEGYETQRLPGLTRVLGPNSWVIYSALDSASAPRVVEEQTAFFRSRGGEVEWKIFAHDRPPELAGLLEAQGYVADTPETLVVLDLAQDLGTLHLPASLEVRRIERREDLISACRASEEAFGAGDGWDLEECLNLLGNPSFGAFAVLDRGNYGSVGRLSMPPGRSFAGLWGGATVPGYRGRGLYRALVIARAEVARARGYSYLTVDARATSRPILERMGFLPLDPVQGWVLHPGD